MTAYHNKRDPYPVNDPTFIPPVRNKDPRRSHPAGPHPKLYSVLPGQAPGRQVRGLRGMPDGRTRLGRLVNEFKRSLVAYVGGDPDPVEKALIDGCVALRTKCLILEQKMARGGESELDTNWYLAWQNALRRHLAALNYSEAAQVVRKNAEARLVSAYAKR